MVKRVAIIVAAVCAALVPTVALATQQPIVTLLSATVDASGAATIQVSIQCWRSDWTGQSTAELAIGLSQPPGPIQATHGHTRILNVTCDGTAHTYTSPPLVGNAAYVPGPAQLDLMLAYYAGPNAEFIVPVGGQYRVITLVAALPTLSDQCKDGGWEAFPFRNQGQCVDYVEHLAH